MAIDEGLAVTIPCPYYRKCSGCSELAVPYAKQLRGKSLRVREVLASALRLNLPPAAMDQLFLPIMPSPLPLGYRASTKLCLNMDSFGQRSIGLYVRGSKTVVDIPTCPVHAPAINKVVQKIFAGSAKVPAPFYQHTKRSFQPGCLKFVTLRYSPATGMTGMILSHTGVERAALVAWAQQVAQPNLGIYESVLSKADDDRILSERTNHLAGPEKLSYQLAGQLFQLPPLAFFQANFSLTEAFVSHITAAMHGRTLLDLYGGFGAYSWAAASGFAATYLVDGNASAIAAAREQTPAVAGLKPVHASVEDFFSRHVTPRMAREVTHVIVNPPRAGLSAKVKAALSNKSLPELQELVYVSCNVDTLAQDLRVLSKGHRLRLASIQAFDMFPQTEHIEVVAKLII